MTRDARNSPSTKDALAELIAAAEAVARDVTMPIEGIDDGFVKVQTPLATRLIHAVVDVRSLQR